MTKKIKSRKFWFTVWAALSASIVMFFSVWLKFEASWMTPALALLIGIVTAYVAIGASKKKKEEE